MHHIQTMRRFWLTIAAVVATQTSVPAQGLDDGPFDFNLAAQWFEEAKALSDADGGRLWGKSLYGPMLLPDRQTRSVVANMADKQNRLSADGSVFTGRLTDEVGIANTATTWAGRRWTMIMWPLPNDESFRKQLIAHELFHRIQDDLGLPLADPSNAHLDDRDGRIWMRLEMKALAATLESDGTERSEALNDALVFRARRRALCGNKAARDECALELNEGLAEYTGLRLCGLDDRDVAQRAADRLKFEQSSTSFTRTFAYAVGPAYGLVLDELSPNWREGLEAGADLGKMAGQAAGFKKPGNLVELADQRAQQYDAEEIIAAETTRHEAREQRLAEFRQRFIDGPVLIVKPASHFNYTFNPSDIEAFPGKGQVMGSTRMTDDWGVLEVAEGGILMVRDATGFPIEFRVAAPSAASASPTEGEGWTLTLNDDWAVVPGRRRGDFEVRRRGDFEVRRRN